MHEADEAMIELDVQEIEPEARGAAKARAQTKKASPGSTSGGKKLTKEQQEMLARMGGGFDKGPKLQRSGPSSASRKTGKGLTAAQLSRVVNKGRNNLQRCYEVALRGSGSEETVRMDVEISVSENGNVTRVRTTGQGLPNMATCIKRTVRAWRFPASGTDTQTKFPLVFQPGA